MSESEEQKLRRLDCCRLLLQAHPAHRREYFNIRDLLEDADRMQHFVETGDTMFEWEVERDVALYRSLSTRKEPA